MALVVKDRVRETTTTTGTGTLTLAGPVTGYQSFSTIGNANTTYYTITDGTNWEVGIGTYTASGTTLSRDTVLASSNSGSLVSFSAGSKDVFVTYPAGKAITDGYGLLPAANGGTGQSSYAVGDIIYASTTTALSKLADVATGNALISGGVNTAPSWGKVGLTTHVSGTLDVANGGTGTATAFTAGSVVFAGTSGVYTQDNTNLSFDDTNNQLNVAGITIGRGGGGSATNTLVGNSSFTSNTTGTSNVVVGYGAGNTPYTTTATCVVVGASAGAGIAGNDTVVGANALSTANAGGWGWNTAIGAYSLRNLTSGTTNTALGTYSAQSLTTGSTNVALGYSTMPLTTTGQFNVSIGYNSLAANVSGFDNVAIGRSAGYGFTGSNQIAIGRDSGASNGFTLAIGMFAGSGVNTGYANMAIGNYTMQANGSGAENTAIGEQALRYNTSGTGTVAVGNGTLNANTTGYNNTAVGQAAMASNTTGERSTVIGSSAGYDLTTGGYNIIIGYNTGRGITTGVTNTIIGSQITGLAANLSNHVIIGDGNGNKRIVVDASGYVGLGTNVTPTSAIDTDGSTLRLRTSRTPASATAAGNAGEICWDADYIYVCTATNTWKRAAITTW